MSSGRLIVLDAGPGTLQTWVQALGDALEGSGPALAPLPAGPRPQRDAFAAAVGAGDAVDVVAGVAQSAQVALVIPTSGSTGTPKAAMLTAAAVHASAAATHSRLGGPGRWVLALPLTHVAGIMVVVRALAAGAPPWDATGEGGFDPARFAEATDAQASRAAADGLGLYTSLVPTQLARLLDAPAGQQALARYDAVLVGAAATPGALRSRAEAVGARIVTTYGMSETCGGCVYDGVPLDGVGVELDTGGTVMVSGPTLFAGYLGRPDLTAAAFDPGGRLITSDRGSFDEQGRLRILGRADDIIVTGGEKVAPVQVEDALTTLPGVAAAVVVGVPDEKWGQRVVAVVVPRSGWTLTLDQVRQSLAEALPAPALPRQLVVVSGVPVLASGKPDRAAASALATAPAPAGARTGAGA